jgi:hypothetical protein
MSIVVADEIAEGIGEDTTKVVSIWCDSRNIPSIKFDEGVNAAIHGLQLAVLAAVKRSQGQSL